jgi:hypothetical protein
MLWSRSGLFRDGCRWVRLWDLGPGLAVERVERGREAFSIRQGLRRALRIGPFLVTYVPKNGSVK